MVRGKNRIPYWIDWRLTGLAEPDYDATISFGLPIEPEDSQYEKYRLKWESPERTKPSLVGVCPMMLHSSRLSIVRLRRKGGRASA